MKAPDFDSVVIIGVKFVILGLLLLGASYILGDRLLTVGGTQTVMDAVFLYTFGMGLLITGGLMSVAWVSSIFIGALWDKHKQADTSHRQKTVRG